MEHGYGNLEMIDRIRAERIGPINEADIRFGDITIFVGPQATGKSIFLQLLKLLSDRHSIHSTMQRYGMTQGGRVANFLDLYFGEGMASIWNEKESRLWLGRARNSIDLTDYSRAGRSREAEGMFYIPAQRVMSLRDGMTRPFSEYRAGDPFVLRDFSDKLHWIVQNELGFNEDVFPRARRIATSLREPLEKHIFGGFALRTDETRNQGRLVLNQNGAGALPYLVWSAGQREFVPLLLGLYWLLPPAATPRRGEFEWVIIEEPEMGLHPNGIGAVLNLVMNLRSRGYRICLSTHSPHVLDVIWALRFFQENGGGPRDVLKLLDLRSGPKTKKMAEDALGSTLETYYFTREGTVRRISDLDPGSDDIAVGGWGGLTEFSGRVGDAVADVASRTME